MKERRTKSLLWKSAAEMMVVAALDAAGKGCLAGAGVALVVARQAYTDQRRAREAAEAALRRERADADAERRARAAAEATLARERVVARARVREEGARADEARADGIAQERERADRERERQWMELHRDYPIPEYLEGFVSGAGILSDEDGEEGADRCVNFAIVGESGTGKSSLVRELLRQLGSEREEEPLASFESEGTARPTCYVVPGLDDRVRLWDLPGQGTEGFPAASYPRDVGLKYFDGLLVATDGRWKALDAALLEAIRAAGIWCRIVRTKIDLAVEAGAHDHGMSPNMALAQARTSLQAHLVDADPGTIHLVTTRSRFWHGVDGGAPYGRVSPLCNEVMEYIVTELRASAPMVEVAPDQEVDFETSHDVFEVVEGSFYDLC